MGHRSEPHGRLVNNHALSRHAQRLHDGGKGRAESGWQKRGARVQLTFGLLSTLIHVSR